MTEECINFELDFTTSSKTVPCPNCNEKLKRKTVISENSVNVGRPYVACEQCSDKGKICFWFLDFGECDLCRCPIYQGRAKKGKHAGKLFEVCSQGCPGKFRWLE